MLEENTQELLDAKRIKQQEYFYRMLGVFAIIVLLGGFVLWAALAPLQASVVSEGVVVVDNRNVMVQHSDGGEVSEIHIREGQLVEKGQLLLQLSTSTLGLELESMTAKYNEAKVKEFLLTEELMLNKNVVWPEALNSLMTQPQWRLFLNSSYAFHQASIERYLGEISLFDEKLQQSKLQTQSLLQRKTILNERIQMLDEDINDQEKLFNQKLTDKRRLRELLIDKNTAQSELKAIEYEIGNLESSVSELALQKMLYQQSHRQEKEGELIVQKSTLFSLEPQMKIIERKILNSHIYATTSGAILGFKINTPGQLVAPQANILEIVPSNQSFVFDAKVLPKDIDLVKVGQEVEVKFSSFNIRFEYSMFGRVERIGADVKMDETTRTYYYQVTIKPTDSMLEDIKQNQWQLMSGMPVALFIQTRQQTFAQYLLRPFKEALMKAFNEDDGLN